MKYGGQFQLLLMANSKRHYEFAQQFADQVKQFLHQLLKFLFGIEGHALIQFFFFPHLKDYAHFFQLRYLSHVFERN